MLMVLVAAILTLLFWNIFIDETLLPVWVELPLCFFSVPILGVLHRWWFIFVRLSERVPSQPGTA